MKIGLLIIATNRYTEFLPQLISSADKFFLPNHDVTYFIFTNKDINIDSKRSVLRIHTEHKDWPWMTLGRYKIFAENKHELSKMDYLYYCDADMKFVNEVGDLILGDMVGTLHPGFYNDVTLSNIALEKNKLSLAYLPPNTIENYYAGGFNGGSSHEFLRMSLEISKNIDLDLLENNIIAVWHDESHMNKYFFNNPPTIKLPPSYCYPESIGATHGKTLPFEPILIALTKNHSEYRSI